MPTNSVIAVKNEPYVYSTNDGLNINNVALKPDVRAWAKKYAEKCPLLDYDNFYLSDGNVTGPRLSASRPATVICLSAIDPQTNRGVMGLMNGYSSGMNPGSIGSIAANEFKKEFFSSLQYELEKAGIKAAVYDNKVEFILVMEGKFNPNKLASVFKKAISSVSPRFQTKINGKPQVIKLFESAKRPPEIKYGYTYIDNPCSGAELKAVTDNLFKAVKAKKYGAFGFNALFDGIKANEPFNIIKRVKLVEADWHLTNSMWEHYGLAYYDCNERLPDEFVEMLKNSKVNYGIEIDPRTKEYLIFRNRQLYMNEPTGALNKAAFNKSAHKVLFEKPANVWIAGGDIYNVTALNKTIGRTLTDNYLKTFIETWKETAERFSVKMDIFRVGGDEVAFIIRDADAEKIARMNMDFCKKMNTKSVLPDEMLAKIPKNEYGLLIKSGLIEKGPSGEIKVNNMKYGDIVRDYHKIPGVKTKGSQYSFFAEKISQSERRLDPEHFKEWLISESSKHANKVYSETTVVLKQEGGFVVVDPKGIQYYKDYSLHRINPSADNIEAVINIITKDPKARLISSEKVSSNLKVDTYRLSNGTEMTIQTEVLKDCVRIKTGDILMKLKRPTDATSTNINLSKSLFKNPDEIYARIIEQQKQGLKDSEILNRAIAQLERDGMEKYVAQVKLLNKLGRIAAPLGVAATLYGIHMINTAPPEKRAELYIGFASGFGAFVAGTRVGFKFMPGNPLIKAAGGFALGTAFAIIGDSAMKKTIDNIPSLKAFLGSRRMQALMGSIQIFDPFVFLGVIKESITGTEYQIRNKFVAQYGVDNWNDKIDKELHPIKEKVKLALLKLQDPINNYISDKGITDTGQINGDDLGKYVKNLQREVARSAPDIEKLEAKKYHDIDSKDVSPEYRKYIRERLQKEAQTGQVMVGIKG